MGVHGLWQLLSPSGRRVSIETLRGQRLAVDISIWLTQFLKAMRDDHGNMMPHAHLLGVFRRICKLLFYRIRPVIVFDGGAPVIKRRTVLQRQQRRMSKENTMRQSARKLLLNQLGQKHLKV